MAVYITSHRHERLTPIVPGGMTVMEEQYGRVKPEMDNTTNDAHAHHDEYWSKVKHDAEQRMAAILRGPAPTTKHELSRAKLHVERHGHPIMKVEMDIAGSEWLQAYHELEEHKHKA